MLKESGVLVPPPGDSPEHFPIEACEFFFPFFSFPCKANQSQQERLRYSCPQYNKKASLKLVEESRLKYLLVGEEIGI